MQTTLPCAKGKRKQYIQKEKKIIFLMVESKENKTTSHKYRFSSCRILVVNYLISWAGYFEIKFLLLRNLHMDDYKRSLTGPDFQVSE